MASVTSNGVDGQLPPVLNVRKPTSGKHHQARLAPSRAEVKATEPSVIATMEKVKEKERNPTSSKSCEKNITQPHVRHAFFDPAHGSRVRLSAASLTNFFQAPILRQEVDHDPMPMDAYDGSSKQSRCDIVATNSSALSLHDFPPLQLQAESD